MADILGERLKEYRKHKGLSQKELSVKLDVSQGSLSELEGNKYAPSAETIETIIRNTDINIEWLLTGEGEMLKKQPQDEIEFVDIKMPQLPERVPVYEFPVSAGYDGAFDENPIEGYMKPLAYDFVVKIKGKSMEPLIPEGFFVALVRTKEVVPDKPLLIKYQIEPGLYMHAIKFVKILNGSCELISANPEFKTIVPCNSMEVLGVVIATFKGF